MMIQFGRRLQIRLVAALLALALVAGFAGSAEASGPKPTPNGYCGALNMANDAALPHMIEAMASHTAEQGDAGMTTAVVASACS